MTLLRALMALLLISLATNSASARQFVVATWNIRSGAGCENSSIFGHSFFYGHGSKYLDRVASQMEEQSVDVLCLQEVQGRSLRSLGFDQTKRIAKKMGFQYRTWGSAKSNGVVVSRQGNAIVSRWPIHRVETLELNEGSKDHERRIALIANIEVPGSGSTGVWVVSVHLDAKRPPETRLQELDVMAERLNALEGPVVLTGDFNARPDSAEYAKTLAVIRPGSLSDAVTEDGPSQATSTAPNPKNRIDYVFVDGVTALSARAVTEAGSTSDHLPVVAVLDLPTEPAVMTAAHDEAADSSLPGFDSLSLLAVTAP